jgi:cell wall-associated NlpC family hydrolase
MLRRAEGLAVALVCGLCFAPGLTAQGAHIDVSYGPWWSEGDIAFAYGLSLHQRLLGPLDWGIGVTHLADHRAVDDRTLTGGTISLAVNRRGQGPYVLGGWGLGLRHDGGEPDAFWSLGAGYAVRPLPLLSLGLEALYRVEDRRIRGFWQLDAADRRGILLQGRLALSLGGRASGRSTASPRPTGAAPQAAAPGAVPLATAAHAAGASADVVALRRQVAQTALDAMGSPYRWGGSDDNGYDCSGLIQFAYGEHGIILPRRSRDQARVGEQVEQDVGALEPGDILGFRVSGSGVSHVGLYVGEGRFIHSTSSGVKLSSLTATDPDGRWWRQRWVTVRRVLP